MLTFTALVPPLLRGRVLHGRYAFSTRSPVIPGYKRTLPTDARR